MFTCLPVELSFASGGANRGIGPFSLGSSTNFCACICFIIAWIKMNALAPKWRAVQGGVYIFGA